MKPDNFPLPSKGQPFVPGDVSGWTGFELEPGETLDHLARRWFESAELYLCMFLAIPPAGRERYCGRAKGCRLEKVPVACEWGKSLRRQSSPLTQRWLSIRRLVTQWLRAEGKDSLPQQQQQSSAEHKLRDLGEAWDGLDWVGDGDYRIQSVDGAPGS